MLVPFVAEPVVWYGPATVTFTVQYAGNPYDPVRNDVRVRFIGDKNQREERLAYFDSRLGVWRAILYSTTPGSYRAVLVRNGSESEVEAAEGIVELKRSEGGTLPAKQPREDRWTLDTGDEWAGFGSLINASNKASDVNALADAGATWLLVQPAQDLKSLTEWDEVMDAVEKRDLSYTIQVPDNAAPAWRRYVLARYGTSPRLVQWDTKTKMEDPWTRGISTALPWQALFENERGPFLIPSTKDSVIKALKTALRVSDWARWRSPKAWKGLGASGVADGNRMILEASPKGKIEGLPLPDGTYDLTTIDGSTGGSTIGTVQIQRGTFETKASGETFLVLRRRN